MDLSKIVAISGKSGLGKVISQGRNCIIVESLIDGKRFPAYATQKISILEEIAIFTVGEEKPLKEVFKLIFDKQGNEIIPDSKINNNEELKKYFEEILPEYDKTRVYVSDIKKVFLWYNILVKNNLLDFSEENKTKSTSDIGKSETENTDNKEQTENNQQ